MTTATASIPAPRCGACGYDTTGLTTLTCPECGVDLRVAGIHRRGRTHSVGAFVASTLALLLAWIIAGMVLMSVINSLLPIRQHIEQTTRLGAPRSGAYRFVEVIATGSGWTDDRPRLRVELKLEPLSADETRPAAIPPLAASRPLTSDDVLAWLASTGVDRTDLRVRDEAQTIALAATRALRMRGRLGSGFGWGGSGFSGTSFSGGLGGPFSRVTSNLRGSSTRTSFHTPIFNSLWVVLLAAGIAFLWRCMRPRVRTPRSTASP